MISIEQNALNFLGYFTPLLQLWTGICLLFFYLKLLENSPLKSHINKVNKSSKEKSKDILNKFQGNISIDDKNLTLVSTNWKEFVPRIKNIAALTFFYCLFLLYILCVGRYSNANDRETNCVYLLTTSSFIFVYIICCSFFNLKIGKTNQVKIFHNYLTPIIYILLLSPFYFICFEDIENWYLEKLGYDNLYLTNIISICVLLTCGLGIMSVLIYIIKDWVIIEYKKIKLDILTKNVKRYYEAMLHKNPMNELPRSYQKKIKNKLSKQLVEAGQVTRKEMEKFIEEEIQEEYKKIFKRKGRKRKTLKWVKKLKKYFKEYSAKIKSSFG